MADKNLREANLANAVHEAKYQLGEALAQPAGAGRLDKIAKADTEVIKAQAAYQDCLDGRGYSVPFKR